MRIITVALVMLALLATSASAQMGGGRKHNREDDNKKTEKAPKYDEQAYKAALDSIPVAKHPYDPWGHMRPADHTKTPK